MGAMKDSLEGNPVVKSLSQTRWSAQLDATRALTQSYEEVQQTLMQIAQHENEKAEVRQEATGLLKKTAVPRDEYFNSPQGRHLRTVC